MAGYQEWIDAMHQKYSGLVSSQGLDSVTVHAVAPSRLRGQNDNGERIMVPSGQGAGSGARFYGRGTDNVSQIDKPAGVVEEEEMVVEADMVDKIGGPGRVREGLETLADMKKQGVVRSFQVGTGNTVAGKVKDPIETTRKAVLKSKLQEKANKPMAERAAAAGAVTKDTARQQAIESQIQEKIDAPMAERAAMAGARRQPIVSDTQPDLNLPDAPQEKTATEVTEGIIERGPSRFSETTDKAIQDLSKIAAGESETMKMVTDKSMQELAGTQAARSAALDQELAQTGVEGGAARVARAMERRQAGIEESGLRGDLAIEQQQRMERASERLASLGLQGEQLEEAKHQLDVGIKKWGQEFEEASKQWGANFLQRQAEFTETANQFGKEFALAKEKYEYGKNKEAIADALAAGDFDKAEELYANMGVNINMDALREAGNAQSFNDAMDGVASALASGLDFNNATTQSQLKAAWEAQNPDINWGSRQAQEWAQNTYDSMRLNNDPVYQAVHAIEPETLTDMLAGMSGDPDFNIENVEFGGKKGVEAGYAIITALQTGGGMRLTDNGFEVDQDSPIWEELGYIQTTPDSGNIPPKFRGLSAVKDASNDTVVTTDVGTIYKDNAGNVYEIDMPKQNATALGGRDVAFHDGTNWVRPTVGQIIEFESNVNAPEIPGYSSLPKGVYEVVNIEGKTFYKNLRTGQNYAADIASATGSQPKQDEDESGGEEVTAADLIKQNREEAEKQQGQFY